MEDSQNSFESAGSITSLEDVVSPSKIAKFDFFAELKKQQEEGSDIKIKDLRPGKIWKQKLTVVVSWIDRDPGKFLAFHGFDGSDYVVFKTFKKNIAKFSNEIKEFETYSFSCFNVAKVGQTFRNPFNGEVEIIVDDQTEITDVAEEGNIILPDTCIPIKDLDATPIDEFVDVKGILVKAGQPTQTAKGKDMRALSIIDQSSEKTLTVYLWNNDAKNFSHKYPCPISLRRIVKKDDNMMWFGSKSSLEVSKNVDKDGTMMSWFEGLLDG